MPTRCSRRRAKYLSGLSTAAIEQLVSPTRGEGYCNVPIAALEHILGRKITWEDWEDAGNRINRDAAVRVATRSIEAA